MSERIIFNGRIYQSSSEMPPDVRQLYDRLASMLRDDNMDGVPDIIQQGGLKRIREAFGMIKDLSNMAQSHDQWSTENLSIITETDTSISVNGKTFRSVAEMPTDVRRIYQKAVLDADPSSVEIFDEPWRERDRDSFFIPHDDEIIEPEYHMPASSPVIQPVNSNFGLIVAIALLVLICVGVSIYFWYANGVAF